jgi:4-diphosphocytidyl-2-C-methyl-D-erythritol kinase
MSQTLDFRSPAKLNLMLHITGQRDDGYHLLQTAFQLIDLNDELSFTVTDSGHIRRVASDTPVAEDEDIVLRAAQLLQQRYEVTSGVNIQVRKHIPTGGGLGGGSSDAATTLMALNRLWKLGLDQAELQRIGLELGADVPLFIFGRNAWGEGVGECLEALDLPKKWYLVVHPRIFVSTGLIFSDKDLTRDCHPIKIRAFLEGEGSNVCEPVACRLYPEVEQARDWLNQFSPARMTGTGACIFAAFASEAEANDIKSRLPEQWTGFVAKSLNYNPVTEACF